MENAGRRWRACAAVEKWQAEIRYKIYKMIWKVVGALCSSVQRQQRGGSSAAAGRCSAAVRYAQVVRRRSKGVRCRVALARGAQQRYAL